MLCSQESLSYTRPQLYYHIVAVFSLNSTSQQVSAQLNAGISQWLSKRHYSSLRTDNIVNSAAVDMQTSSPK